MAKKAQPKLNDRQLIMMAAIMGLSNSGADHLFRGPHPEVKPDDVMDAYTEPNRGRGGTTLEGMVIYFGNGLFENEEMLAGFVDEASSWVKTLKKMSTGKIKTTWPDYAPFVDAMGA